MKNMFRFSIILTGLVLFFGGCSSSQRVAQEGFDKGTRGENNVRDAFFAKGWGLNRSLITESRLKFLAQAQVAMLKARHGADGVVGLNDMETILKDFERELGEDEVVTSENFAYLAFLMEMGERADDYLSNVDIFLEAKKPIWKRLSSSSREGTKNVAEEYKAWEPLIRNLKKHLDEYKKLFEEARNASPSK